MYPPKNVEKEWEYPKNTIRGFVYQISYDKCVKGYLFGSQHQLPTDAKIDPRMQQVIDRCQKVYLELKVSEEILQTGTGLDHRIARNREVFGLEQPESSHSRSMERFNFQYNLGDAMIEGTKKSIESWWNGNQIGTQDVLKTYTRLAPLEMKSLVFSRTSHWMGVMTAELNIAKEPVAFVVGALHLFDEGSNKGCVTLLKDAGFELTSVYDIPIGK